MEVDSRVPIDRGYGWITVLGAAIGTFFVIGGFKSMGILFVEFLDVFEASQGLTAVMMGVILGGMSIFSPFATAIGSRFSMRAVVMSGGVFLALAALGASFAPNIYCVIFLFGGMTGLGIACIYAPSFVVVGEYFDRRRSLACGLTMAGASIGQLVTPLVVTALFKHFHFQGALLIYSAFVLHAVVGGALLRPSSFYKRSAKDDLTKDKRKSKVTNDTSVPNSRSEPNSVMPKQPIYDSTGSLNLTAHQAMGSKNNLDRLVSPSSGGQEECKVMLHRTEERKTSQSCCFGTSRREERNSQCLSCDITVLKNPLFTIYLIGICLGASGYTDMVLFIPPHAKDCGMAKETAALLLSICGSSDFFGRILGGWFADLGLVKRCTQMGLSLIVVGLFAFVCTFFRTFASLAVLSVVLGLVGGMQGALMPVVLVDYVGSEKFPSAFGFTVMFMGLFNIALPALFGKIRDITGAYAIPYFICSGFTILAGCSFLMEPIFRKVLAKTNNKDTKDSAMEMKC